MKKVELKCEQCGCLFERYVGEVKRSLKIGRGSFCSRECAAIVSNENKRSKRFVMNCPVCGVEFETSTHNKAKRHCSRGCASKGSVTPERRKAMSDAGNKNAANLLTVAETMKRREAWKYTALREHLGDRPFEFEFPLDGFVFDLALFDSMVLVEFDGKYHNTRAQMDLDAMKEKVAIKNGFRVERRATATVSVISPAVINGL
jgi:very-short-patch-repair endonuclease